jgi:hypothetical protein
MGWKSGDIVAKSSRSLRIKWLSSSELGRGRKWSLVPLLVGKHISRLNVRRRVEEERVVGGEERLEVQRLENLDERPSPAWVV